MTDINFYVSKEIGLDHRFSIVYRLIGKGLERNLNIYIYTDTEDTSKKIDDYIWTKENTSFIPHKINNDSNTDNLSKEQTTEPSVTISHDFEPLLQCDYLINLSNIRPSFFSRFSKMAEVLDNNDTIINAGRERYSFYRDRGYKLNYHKL